MTAAIIFDMDGVLIDSEPLLLEATNVVLGRRGAHLDASENLAYLGWNQRSYWTDLSRRFELGDALPDLLHEREEVLAGLMERGLEPAPGVVDFAGSLAAAGHRLALATGSGRLLAERVLERIGLAERFPIRACGDEVSRPKPDPEIFLLAARRLGIDPEEALVFEDSVNGVRAARAAGMRVIRVVTDTTRALDFPPVDGMIDGFEGLDARLLATLGERSAP